MKWNFFKDKTLALSRHPFVKDTAVLQVGTMAGNFIQALVGIFLARLLQPELFGIYSLAFSLAGFLILFVGVGAHEAIMTILGEAYEKQDKDEIQGALAFFIKIVVITGALAIMVALLSPFLANFLYKDVRIGTYGGIFVAALFLSTSFLALTRIVLQVVGRIKAMTILGLIDQIARNGISLFLVIFGFGVLGAATGHLIGAVILFFVSVLVWQGVKNDFPIFPSLKKLYYLSKKVSIKKYLGFSFWITIDRNTAMLYSLLPILITGIFVSATEVTYFKLAFGYINLALTFLSPISTLLNVEFPKMKIRDNLALYRNFIKVSLYSVAISCVLVLGAVIVSPITFKILYGDAFMPSVRYVVGLLGYGALMGIGVALGPMWRAINKVKVSIIINLCVLGAGLPLGIYLIKTMGLWGSVIMTTVWFTVSHFISFVYLIRYLKRGEAL